MNRLRHNRAANNSAQATPIWRWLALFAVVANLAFNFLSQRVALGTATVGEVTARYDALFTPAGYAFAIWGLIYLCFAAYAGYALMPSQRHAQIHDRLAKPLIGANVLASAWIVTYQSELIGVSLLIIAAMLVLGAAMFVYAGQAARAPALLGATQPLVRSWVTVPFSLFFGWISLATVANFSVWLKASGWEASAWGEPIWTVVMLEFAVLLGILISWFYRDVVYPLVVAWGTFAIWVAQRDENGLVATAAFVGALVLALWVGICAVRYAFVRQFFGRTERFI